MPLTCIAQKNHLLRLHRGGVVFCSRCEKPIVVGELIVVSGSNVMHEKCKKSQG